MTNCNMAVIGLQDKYDEAFVEKVYNSPLLKLSDLTSAANKREHNSVRVQYSTKDSLKLIVKTLKIMEDFKVCIYVYCVDTISSNPKIRRTLKFAVLL